MGRERLEGMDQALTFLAGVAMIEEVDEREVL
jgi:hypothetical protein